MSVPPWPLIVPEIDGVAVKDLALLQNERFRLCRGVSPKLLLHKDPALHQPVGGL